MRKLRLVGEKIERKLPKSSNQIWKEITFLSLLLNTLQLVVYILKR